MHLSIETLQTTTSKLITAPLLALDIGTDMDPLPLPSCEFIDKLPGVQVTGKVSVINWVPVQEIRIGVSPCVAIMSDEFRFMTYTRM